MARKLTDDFLKLIAEEYRKHALAGSLRPSVEIAQQYGAPVATIRRWVADARRAGHLPPGLKGRIVIEGTAEEPLRPSRLVGAHVRALRVEAGLTQEELGEALAKQIGTTSWSRQAVHAGESGKRAWAALDVVAVARVFGVSPGHFFEPLPEEA
jgi:DNA-binding XRE family transcriptional regulator